MTLPSKNAREIDNLEDIQLEPNCDYSKDSTRDAVINAFKKTTNNI